jgi:uncharacterized Zn finger protein (UPF0148 family)
MRRVVALADYRHSDIKPDALFDRFLELSGEEIRRLLLDGAPLIDTNCPACGGAKKTPAFEKYGLSYVECDGCGSLFISPRPTAAAMQRYADESKASEFWRGRVLTETTTARVEHLITPEVEWVANTTEELVGDPHIFADVHSRSVEFLRGIDELKMFDTKHLIAPDPAVAAKLGNAAGFEPVKDESRLGAIEADVVTAFYALDAAHDPRALLGRIRSMLVRDGLLFIIGSTISGLDLQVLWDKARTLVPPENLNVLSVEGVTTLLEGEGFEIVELSTPGHLDVEYVKAAVERENVHVHRFLQYLIEHRDDNARRALQDWLQEFRLSSHLRVVAKRKA